MRTFLRLICLSGLALLASCGGEKTPDDFEVWGLDVSRHQRNVNWEQVVEHERPDFVLIKATEGTMIVDPTYDRHRKELEKAGVPWGAYHFFGHRTPGKQQARNFIRTAKLDKGNIIPVLDIEKHRFMTDPKKSVREANHLLFDQFLRNLPQERLRRGRLYPLDRRLPQMSAAKVADMAAHRLAQHPGHPGQRGPERIQRKPGTIPKVNPVRK